VPKSLSYVEQTRGEVMRQLRAGELKPGARVKEEALAGVMDLSRTPVRQALLELASEGILVSRRNRGVFVPELEPQQITELGEVRIALESRAAEALATFAYDDAVLPLLRESVETFNELKDPDKHAPDFHRRLIIAVGNAELMAMWESVNTRLQVARWLSGARQVRVQEAIDEHLAIIAAMEARAGEKARRLIAAHIEGGIQYFVAAGAVQAGSESVDE
jgi:DNA-binding GntR family transcriptional regulator